MFTTEAQIHRQAYVEDGVIIGKNVTIEPFAVVKRGVILEDDVVIKSHAYLEGNTTIGKGTIIYPGASIGTKTQDKKYTGETTYVKIGQYCEIREYVTINASCGEGSVVQVGDNCLLMAYCHVAHNCTVGKGVIMANSAMLAGHVEVEDYAILGGMTPVHQFVRIGAYAMVGGLSRITHDIPPYTLGAGIPYKLGGLNLVGLKRHQFPLELRKDLTKAFKLTYRSSLSLKNVLIELEREMGDSPVIKHWIDFAKRSQRGLIGLMDTSHPSEHFEDFLEE